ncbi:hypothetical protein QFZ99_005194 [Paraburkholderia atlantica]
MNRWFGRQHENRRLAHFSADFNHVVDELSSFEISD